MVDPRKNLARMVVARFGGIRPMARLLAIAPSTVQGWCDSRWIPAHRQAEVLAAARREGIALTADEMIGLEEVA